MDEKKRLLELKKEFEAVFEELKKAGRYEKLISKIKGEVK